MARTSLKIMAISLLLAGPALADNILQPVQVGEVTYISGGVGADERAELEVAKKDYNLHIMNAGTKGELMGGALITIHDAKGAEVLNVQSEPLLYVKLPVGSYLVEGTNNEVSRKQKITISAKQPAHIHFSWQSDPQ